MLYKNLILVFVLIIAGVFAAPAVAGVDGPGEDCPKKKKATEDSLDIYAEENKVQEEVFIPPAVPAVQPVRQRAKDTQKTTTSKTTTEQTQEEDPNSAMSFNFIYYIIDKFKFTDPLE